LSHYVNNIHDIRLTEEIKIVNVKITVAIVIVCSYIYYIGYKLLHARV